MWFKDDKGYSKRRYSNRRFADTRNSILMVSARVSDQKKKIRYKLGAIVLLLVVLAGTAFAVVQGAQRMYEKLFADNERFLIERLDVVSDGKLRVEHVRQFAHIEEGMNLFAVDLQQVRDSLAAVPLVADVEVRRRLPDTLEVRISERVAIARLGDESTGYPMAMDREGVVLGPGAVSAHLPFISGFRMAGLRPGVQVDHPAVKTALEIVELCDTPQYSRFLKVARIDVGGTDHLDLRLAQGERVLMPKANLPYKIEKLCDIIKMSADMGQAVASVDMTVDRNFPVKYR
jgi:cell division septal protein FtsQ